MRCYFLLLALVASTAQAASLRDAVEKAWQRQPAAQALGYRTEELAARRDAVSAFTPAPPSLVLRQRTDRLNSNTGTREAEVELAVPLWLPGQRDRETAVVSAEQAQLQGASAAAKWKLAGEVREVYWQARLADVELIVARRRLDDAVTLAADVERRVRAGDLARTDFNQAKAVEQSARAALAEAEVRAFKGRQSFTLLTGFEDLPRDEEGAAPDSLVLENHSLLRQLDQTAATADARLRLASDIKRDNPELAFTYRRERAIATEPFDNSVGLSIRIPFATDGRNRPRIAAANADLIEARTTYQRERGRLEADIAVSRREVQQTQTALALAQERLRLSAETDQLLGKAFTLGEIDLATRLRVAAERYAAEADVARSQLEARRAVSRLNQAMGVLP